MSINSANLTFNGVTAETTLWTGQASLNGRFQWEYTDTGQTLAQLDGEDGTGVVAEKLRQGDMVKVTGSDGVGFFMVGRNAGTVYLAIIASGEPSASFWV